MLRKFIARIGWKLVDWGDPADAEFSSEDEWGETFIDGTGKVVRVHKREPGCDISCCIHNPSEHALVGAPLVWREAGAFDIKPSHMERICVHGVGHPDPDSLAYLRRIGNEELANGLAIHGCDGCCGGILSVS